MNSNENTWQKQFGINLNDCRKSRNLTHEELAKYMSVDVGTVKKWTSGANLPSIDTLYRLSEVLGEDVNTLLGVSKRPRTKNILVSTIYLHSSVYVYEASEECGDIVYRMSPKYKDDKGKPVHFLVKEIKRNNDIVLMSLYDKSEIVIPTRDIINGDVQLVMGDAPAIPYQRRTYYLNKAHELECFMDDDLKKILINHGIKPSDFDKKEIQNMLDACIRHPAEHEESFAHFCDDDKEVAKAVISFYETFYTEKCDTYLHNYVFKNTDRRDKKLQAELLADKVKNIRNTTGLSQAKFAEALELNVSELKAIESGKKKISKRKYDYLTQNAHGSEKCVKIARLDYYLLDDDSQKYIHSCVGNEINYDEFGYCRYQSREYFIIPLHKFSKEDWDNNPYQLKICRNVTYEYGYDYLLVYIELSDYNIYKVLNAFDNMKEETFEGKIRELFK